MKIVVVGLTAVNLVLGLAMVATLSVGCELDVEDDAYVISDIMSGDAADIVEDAASESASPDVGGMDVVFDTIPAVPDVSMSDIQAPPVPEWTTDSCEPYVNYWHCTCMTGACCPGCEETWKTVAEVSCDDDACLLLVTDVTEVEAVSYEITCDSDITETYDVEGGMLYVTINKGAIDQKVFKCAPVPSQ